LVDFDAIGRDQHHRCRPSVNEFEFAILDEKTLFPMNGSKFINGELVFVGPGTVWISRKRVDDPV